MQARVTGYHTHIPYLLWVFCAYGASNVSIVKAQTGCPPGGSTSPYVVGKWDDNLIGPFFPTRKCNGTGALCISDSDCVPPNPGSCQVPPTRCHMGANDGLLCNSDADCPKRCHMGSNNGNACTSNTNCPEEYKRDSHLFTSRGIRVELRYASCCSNCRCGNSSSCHPARKQRAEGILYR